MTFCQVLSSVSVAAVLAVASAPVAQAQFGGMPGMPGAPGMGGFGAPPSGPPAGPPPACQQLMVLRDERQKSMDALTASKGKADPVEACKLFKTLISNETKFIQGLETNSTQCGVPATIIKQAHDGHNKALQIEKQVCDAAEHPRSTAPSLSDALNSTPVLPDAESTKSTNRGGTYDTLQGNPLAR
jgi:hypothetical protein